jgi:hypothetical protein
MDVIAYYTESVLNNAMKIYILRDPFIDPYFDEYVENMGYHFENRGYTLEKIDRPLSLDTKDPSIVLFFWTSWKGDLHVFPQHTYILANTEQLTCPDQMKQVRDYLSRYPRMLYADYSTANLKLLNTDRPSAHLPFVYQPLYASFQPLPKQIPLLFYGTPSDYRKELCSKYGANVVALFGSARDRMIRLSKCVLNIHCTTDYRVFESMRIYHAIYLGTPVFLGDESLEEDLVLSDTAKQYLLTSSEVPTLPPIDPKEETEIGRRAIDSFISRLSLPRPKDPSTSEQHRH